MTTTTTAVVTIHVLILGYPACRFSGLQPRYWPAGHIWLRRHEVEKTRHAIADPKSGLNDIFQYTICTACERALQKPEPLTADLPIVVAADRRCGRCKYPLTPWWPAIFCSQECALAYERDP